MRYRPRSYHIELIALPRQIEATDRQIRRPCLRALRADGRGDRHSKGKIDRIITSLATIKRNLSMSERPLARPAQEIFFKL